MTAQRPGALGGALGGIAPARARSTAGPGPAGERCTASAHSGGSPVDGDEPGARFAGEQDAAVVEGAERHGRLGSRPGAADGAPLSPGIVRLDLGTGAEVLVAVPEGERRPRPLLVFLHGAGGTAAQSLAAVRDVVTARGALVVAPTSAATTWDLIGGGLGRDVAVLDAALEQVFAGAPVGEIAVGGFSDGASYALSLGLANGDLFGAVLAFSPGFVAPPDRRGSPSVWISHGTEDRVLPVARCGRRVSRELTAAGYDVTYREFAGGHVLTPDLVAAALDAWLGVPTR